MATGRRRAGTAAGVAGLALALVAVGAVVGAGGTEAPPARALPVSQLDAVAAQVASLQEELDRVPGNPEAWAQLGLAYVEQARASADPGLYSRADGALARSLELRPELNDLALAGQAALAAARHDFAGALSLADQALAANPFSATGLAIRVDALTELGRYDDARAAVEQMLRVAPGVESFSRASYAEELRGSTEAAVAAMTAAAEAAGSPGQVAFAQFFLGELAWQTGDVEGARAAYRAGLEASPGDPACRAGLAKTQAAQDPAAAEAAYREVAAQLPQPSFLVELGELLEAGGDPVAAEQQYDVVRATQQLLAAGGQDVDTELAVFEADHGDPAAALASAEAAYAKRGEAVLTQDAYAWALHANGRSAEALPVAQAALRLGTRSPVLHYHLGAIAAAAGDTTTAREALETALDLNPDFSPLHAPRARALLEQLG